MAELVADYVLKRLREWGVHRIYGYPGDGINAFLGALDRADGDPEFIQTRHEEMAAFMACGHAKFAGPDEVGGCMATAGRAAMPGRPGARGAPGQLARVGALPGAGLAKALLGKDVLADDLPYVTGAIGLLGSIPSYDMIEGCDTLLMVGTSFPYAEFLPKEGQARRVEIDIKADMIGMRYPADVQLIGDAKETLKALEPQPVRKEDRGWREQIEEGVRAWWDIVERRSMMDADPMNPQRVVHELSQVLTEDAIITADSGSSTNWFARQLKLL